MDALAIQRPQARQAQICISRPSGHSAVPRAHRGPLEKSFFSTCSRRGLGHLRPSPGHVASACFPRILSRCGDVCAATLELYLVARGPPAPVATGTGEEKKNWHLHRKRTCVRLWKKSSILFPSHTPPTFFPPFKTCFDVTFNCALQRLAFFELRRMRWNDRVR